MDQFTLQTRAHGEVRFTLTPAGRVTVTCEALGRHGSVCCRGGTVAGPEPVQCEPDALPDVAKAWWKQHTRRIR